MWHNFFRDKLERDAALTGRWIDFITSRDDLPSGWNRILSAILNSHHIWNCRLTGKISESEIRDLMPELHWKQLLQANLRETLSYLDDFSSEAKISYHDSEGIVLEQLTTDLLFQLLQDNQFYRGQLALLADQNGLPLPDSPLILLD